VTIDSVTSLYPMYAMNKKMDVFMDVFTFAAATSSIEMDLIECFRHFSGKFYSDG